jgi:Hypothetical glycosyl hydrolase family 15/Ricin-type beta-trefoil lectin domain-like
MSIAGQARATCVTSNNDPGCLHFEWKTSVYTDQYTDSPSTSQQQWFQQHFFRIVGYSPYWDTRLSWFPNSWFYQDSSSIYTTSAVVSQHPEFILRNQSGAMLYINFGCSNGSCPQYAPDYSNENFRQWWIAEAAAIFKAGYKGVFIDDVNLTMNLTNGSTSDTPIDNSTKQPMTQQAWEQYLAGFLTEVRKAFPNAEICHNALWYSGSGNPISDQYVAQEVQAANYINLERGYDDTGLKGDSSFWSVQNFMAYIDAVHTKGTNVVLEQYGSDGTEYALAGYLLTGTGSDLFADDSMTPNNWWSGYDIDLGSALGAHYPWNGLIRRDFQNGMVLMNPPGQSTVTASLGGPMTDLSGNTVSSVTLPASHGAVFLGKPVIIVNGPLTNGLYTLRNVFSGWVLDDPSYSVKSGTQIIQWASNGGNNQKWQFTSNGSGYYTIMNYYSGLYLTSQNGLLLEVTKNNADSQLWSLSGSAPTYVLLNKATNQVIDDPGSSLKQGIGIVTWAANGGQNQKWTVQ